MLNVKSWDINTTESDILREGGRREREKNVHVAFSDLLFLISATNSSNDGSEVPQLFSLYFISSLLLSSSKT